MDYKFKIDKLIGLILDSVENEQNTNLILDSSIAYDVSKELLYKFNANFEYQDGNSFDELLKENDVLSLFTTCSEDGRVRHFLGTVFDEDGNTYPDEDSEVIFIQDSLYDCIDTDVFEGQIGILIDNEEEFKRIVEALREDECDGDCDNCTLHDDDEDYEKEINEDLFETLADEMLVSIGEYAENDKELAYEIICDKLEEAYFMGREDFRDELQDKLYKI